MYIVMEVVIAAFSFLEVECCSFALPRPWTPGLLVYVDRSVQKVVVSLLCWCHVVSLKILVDGV